MNPNALETKAQQRGWKIFSERDTDGPMLTLVRDEWEIWVGFSGTAPDSATLRKPGGAGRQKLALREIGMWVRRDRGQMSRFTIGDRVSIDGRFGTVSDITLGPDPGRVRLKVAYDDGRTTIVYSDQAQHPHAELRN